MYHTFVMMSRRTYCAEFTSNTGAGSKIRRAFSTAGSIASNLTTRRAATVGC
jgi:hypothetical protein